MNNKFENCTDYEIWHEFASRFTNPGDIDRGIKDPDFFIPGGYCLTTTFDSTGNKKSSIQLFYDDDSELEKMVDKKVHDGTELAYFIEYITKLYIWNADLEDR